MASSFVRLADCEYDCGDCNTVHRHSDGEIYDLHAGDATGPKRWIIEEAGKGDDD